MPIDIRNVGAGKISTTSTKSKKVKDSSSESSDSVQSSSSDDSVELTGKASQIQSLIQQMMAQPAVDRSRVEPVKEKVDAGKYEIQAEQVANKMLEFESTYSRVR